MGRTTNEIRERIAKREEKLNRKLNDEEIRKITKTVKRKVNRERFIRGAFLALGVTISASGCAPLLTSGNEETNKQQTETEIDNERNEFVNGLAVDKTPTVPEEKDNSKNSQIRDNVKKEIEELETPEEVLNYIKEIYINEYNEQNNENYTTEQLKFHKTRDTEKLHKDTAINGDIIIKEGYEENNYVDTTAGVITASIKSEDDYIKEKIVNNAYSYKTVYAKDEIVDKYEDNFLVSLAPIVDKGIDWSVAMDKEETSNEVKEKYKNRLIDSVTEYETEKMNENIQHSEETEEQER